MSIDYLKRERLSSDTLFNFSGKGEYFYKKLNDGFAPRFVLEDFSLILDGKYDDFKKAFPMVCFCDTPLSQLKDHMWTYGKFGIGLTKEWGIRKQLSPILYLPSNDSEFLRQLSMLLEKLYEIEDDIDQEKRNNLAIKLSPKLTDLEYHLYHLFRYLKWYDGPQGGRHLTFYDEKEWRYLHSTEKDTEIFYLPEETYDNDIEREKANMAIYDHAVQFTADDIKFLIVPDKSDVNELISYLRSHAQYSLKLNDLIRRIITVEEIENDF